MTSIFICYKCDHYFSNFEHLTRTMYKFSCCKRYESRLSSVYSSHSMNFLLIELYFVFLTLFVDYFRFFSLPGG